MNILKNTSNPRQPTKTELKQLYQFELDNFYELDPFTDIDEAEVKAGLTEAIEDASIAVFNEPSKASKHKMMLVIWELPKRYALYIWQGDELKLLPDNHEWLEEFYLLEADT